MPESEFDRLVGAIRALVSTDSDFVVIGGVALILHGSNYMTQDIDFAYRRDRQNADAIARALAPFHPRPRGWAADLPYVWDGQALFGTTVLTLSTDIGEIDLLGAPDGVDSYMKLRKNATEIEVEGLKIAIASIDDLISMKTAAGRPKDLLHIGELEALKKLIEEEGLGA